MSNNDNKNFFAVFGLLFGAFCWGVIWYPYRIMDDAGVSGIVSSFYTYLIATILAGLFFTRYWRNVLQVPPSIIWLSLVAGWTNMSYVLAIIDGEVMRVMLLFYLSPLWTLIFAHWMLGEKTQWPGLLAIFSSLLGAYIMLYDPAVSRLPLPANKAEWLALSSGIGFSLTNVITRKSTHLSLRAKSFAIWLGVMLMCLFAAPLMHVHFVAPSYFSWTHWLVMTLIALMLIAATWLVQYGVTKIQATRASVLFLFELVVAAVASYYLADEHMAMHEWLGGMLIVLAAIFAAFNHQQDK